MATIKGVSPAQLAGCMFMTACIGCYYPGRVSAEGLRVWLRRSVCVCRQKTQLFIVLPLIDRHEIALYRLASQFLFEGHPKCRESILSSVMAMLFLIAAPWIRTLR